MNPHKIIVGKVQGQGVLEIPQRFQDKLLTLELGHYPRLAVKWFDR